MTKAPTPTEMSKGKWQHKQRHKKVRLNSGSDRLRTVSWSNYSHPTGVVNLVYGPNLPTPRNSRESVAVAEWLSSWLAEQEIRGSIPHLAPWISEIDYLPLPMRDMAEIPRTRRKSAVQPTKQPDLCICIYIIIYV